MSTTNGESNADPEAVPVDNRPERFLDAQAQEPADTEPGQRGSAESVDPAAPPSADFDPAEEPSNPELVGSGTDTGDDPRPDESRPNAEDLPDGSRSDGVNSSDADDTASGGAPDD